MNRKEFLLPLPIIIITTVVPGRDTSINVDLPYFSGVINVPCETGKSLYLYGWFEDTETVSTGTNITFFNLGVNTQWSFT